MDTRKKGERERKIAQGKNKKKTGAKKKIKGCLIERKF